MPHRTPRAPDFDETAGVPPPGPDRHPDSGYPRPQSTEQETQPIEPQELVLSLADLIDERQGEDIVILDVSGPLAIADYFLIATTRNVRHAQALARELMQMAKTSECAFRRVSGLDSESGWVLLDLDLVVVHLFDAERREFYSLESLWYDVPRVPFEARERPASEGEREAPIPGTLPGGWPHSVGDL